MKSPLASLLILFVSTLSFGQINNTGDPNITLDSVIWIGTSKTTYTYLEGKETSRTAYSYDEINDSWIEDERELNAYLDSLHTLEHHLDWDADSNSWVDKRKTENAYDGNGNRIEYEYRLWDTNTHTLRRFSKKIDYTYNINNQLERDTSYSWDETLETWVFTYVREYSYDQNDNNSLTIIYQWNDVSNMWESYSKTEFTYPPNQEIQTQYVWENNGWVKNRIDEHTYDGNDNILVDISYTSYDQNLDLFQYGNRLTYTYNGNNQTITYIYDTYDGINDQWLDNEETTYTYDNDDRTGTIIKWNSATNQWDNKQLNENQYADDGTTLGYTYYGWDAINEIWEGGLSWEGEIDQYYNRTSYTDYDWNDQTNDWDLDEERVYINYYSSGLITDISEANAQSMFSVFPNPSSATINVPSGQTTTIYSYEGQVVLSSKDSQLDISHLNAGMYIVTQGDRQATLFKE